MALAGVVTPVKRAAEMRHHGAPPGDAPFSRREKGAGEAGRMREVARSATALNLSARRRLNASHGKLRRGNDELVRQAQDAKPLLL